MTQKPDSPQVTRWTQKMIILYALTFVTLWCKDKKMRDRAGKLAKKLKEATHD